jgi:hypothetical protein
MSDFIYACQNINTERNAQYIMQTLMEIDNIIEFRDPWMLIDGLYSACKYTNSQRLNIVFEIIQTIESLGNAELILAAQSEGVRGICSNKNLSENQIIDIIGIYFTVVGNLDVAIRTAIRFNKPRVAEYIQRTYF